MVKRYTPNTRQLSLEIDAALRDALDGYKDSRGEKLRAVVERALRREMAYPPPPDKPAPLPDSPAKRKPARKRGGKKK